MERKLSTNIWTEVCLHVHSGEMSLNDRTTICINFIGETFIYVQRCEYSNKSRIVKCTWGAEKGEKYAWSRESCFIPTCTRSPLVRTMIRTCLSCWDGDGMLGCFVNFALTCVRWTRADATEASQIPSCLAGNLKTRHPPANRFVWLFG